MDGAEGIARRLAAPRPMEEDRLTTGSAAATASSETAAPARRTRPYEGMFVAFNKEARKTHDYLDEHIKALLEKVGAKVIRFNKWDQRQLAFEINGQREGIYYLVYFEAPTDVISHLKREAELSELVLRFLVLALDRIPTEDELRKRSSSAEEAMREGEELRGEGGFDGGRRPRNNDRDRRGPPGPPMGGEGEREREPDAV
jgi:small subunit ribosomal protein S6